MNLNIFLKTLLALVVVTILVSATTFAQTVYVDVTNGSDTYSGANATNSPAGTGPKATIDAGLTALPNNGTLVIMAGTYNGGDGAGGNIAITTGTYANLVAGGSITIKLQNLNSNNQINLSAGSFTYDVSGGTLNINAGAGTEYLTLNNNLILGDANNNVTMSIPNSSFVQIATGQTITMNGSSNFSNQAPKSGTDISLSYQGGSSITAGPESNYGSYGAGTITVNKTAGTSVTFPNSISAAGGIAVTSGNASFTNAVTLGANEILNSGTGSLNFNGAVSLGIANANIGNVVNSSTGSIAFSNTVTWTGTFTNSPAFTVIDNQNTGSVAFNSSLSFVSPNNAGQTATLTASNDAAGTLTIGTASYTTPNTSNVLLNVKNQAASGILNLAGGTISGNLSNANATSTTNVNAALTVSGTLNNAGTIALGGNTLTLDGSATNTTAGGTVTATSAGGINVNGSGTTTFNGGALSNLMINGNTTINTNTVTATNLTVTSGTLTLGSNLTMSGSTTINGGTVSVGAFTLQTVGFVETAGSFSLANAASVLNVKGDLSRTSGTFSTVAGSTVQFTGTVAQNFAGGPLIEVNNLTFTNTAGAITLAQSVRVDGTVTISANTNVALGTLNIILFANSAGIVNSGSYSASGGGGVIFGGVTTITGAQANYTGQTISGAGVYSYLTVDVGSGNTATVNGNVLFNGVLTLTSGTLNVAAASDLSPSGTSASVIRNMVAGNGAQLTTTGTFDAQNTNYDLTYTGTLGIATSVATGSSEFIAAYVRNLTISTTAKILTLTSTGNVTINGNLTLGANALFNFDAVAAYNVTIKGVLTVSSGATLGGGNAANPITLSGSNLAHVVTGTVSDAGVLTVTGSGSTLNGSTVAADAATIGSLAFEPTANSSGFTSTNLKSIGAITIEGASTATGTNATITMNGTTSTLVGNLTVGNGANSATVGVTINGTTTSTHGGAIVLTNGSLTYTRGGASTTLTGPVTLTAGSLTLGSNVTNNGTTAQAAGNLVLGADNYTAVGAYTRTGAGTLTASTGNLVIAAGGAVNFDPGATAFTVPNLTIANTGANLVTLLHPVTVSTSLTQTSGSFDFDGNNVTLSGNTYTYTAGAYQASGGGVLMFTGSAATATFAGDVTIPSVTVNGTLTLASNNTTARNITVGTAFILTAGAVNQGINNLIDNGTFTYTAGSITQGTGVLTWNTAAPSLAAGFAVDNLTISGAANVGTAALIVNKYLTLAAELTTSADGKLTLGSGATIEVAVANPTLSNVPTFGATTNLIYSSGAAITAAKEQPATVGNYYIKGAATNVSLAANVAIKDTLTIEGTLTQGSKVATMNPNSTLDLRVPGTTALDKALTTTPGTMNLIYEGTFTTSTMELGPTTSAATHTAANVTFLSGAISLDASATFTGNVVFGSSSANGSLALNSNSLYVQGNISQLGTGLVSGGNLYLSGATNTTLSLNGNFILPLNTNLYVSKTNSNNTVTFSGGNLDFSRPVLLGAAIKNNPKSLMIANQPALLYFVNGLLVAGSNSVEVVLENNNSGSTQAQIQGYDRTGVTGTNMSHIVGKVVKNVSTLNGVGRYEFPVGSLTNYKPAAFVFSTAPVYGFNLTVTEVDTTPAGSNGLPIVNGIAQGTNIGSYPNFYWLISSDVSLGTAIQFNLELTAAGFTNFSNVSDLRIIRRVDGDTTANPWALQGSQYDNYLVGSTPTVTNINSVGGINPAGARFTYGLKQIVPTSFAISGKVTYGNIASSPLGGVTVTMNPGGIKATTDANGAYSFANVANGTYTLTATTNKAWAGANATDALFASYYYNGTMNLSSIQQLAADVNKSSSVNNTDALLIVRRFAGLDNSFTAGDWVFSTANVVINNSADTTANLQGLVAGDVNASDDPSGLLKASPSVSLISDGTLKVNNTDAFTVPVNVASNMSLGAVSLRFTYPKDMVTFDGVEAGANFVVNDQNGQVSIAWADLSGGKAPLNIKAGSSLLVFKFKPTANFKTGSQFGLSLVDNSSEFAGVDGKVLSNASLQVATVDASVPKDFTLKQNYPNPFNPSTTIEYDLPMSGNVKLTIYNTLGEQVSTLVNQVQSAGSYKLIWNANNMASGIYFYRITVDGANQKFTQLHKMILLK